VHSGARLVCPCHKGEFDLHGTPVSGPPRKPLPHFLMREGNGGELIVTTTRTVDRAFRLAV
jgi:Rieske Fe-S protein